MSQPVPKNPYGQQPRQLGQAEASEIGQAESRDDHPGMAQPRTAPASRPVGTEPDTNAPYGYDPFGRPYSDKSKIVAGTLSILLGPLGIGRFYTGHTRMAVAQLVTLGGLGVWSLFDGLLMLMSNGKTDAEGRVLRG
ncbi:TM2 domain-containing protein [Streptomyces longispororuber]|uniref:TM2 domain-containing protein n=1 Tax=Streptomyces longispororuber TaxID=68230 RepID=UPI0036F7DBF5